MAWHCHHLKPGCRQYKTGIKHKQINGVQWQRRNQFHTEHFDLGYLFVQSRVIPGRQGNTMGRKQDQAVNSKMSKFGVRKQVDQGLVRQKQQGKPNDSETIRRGLQKSKAGFTLYTHCSDAVKQTKPPVQKSVASNQKQTQGENEAEDQFLQQPDVVSQMQIQNEGARPEETSSIMIPTADFESSGDSTWYGLLDCPEFGTPFNKRLVSSTPDPESLLEAELIEHQINQPSMMCPQVIPERDTTLPSKLTEVLPTVASSLSEKLKIQRQQFQENQQLLQQKQCQQPHNQWQQHSQQRLVSSNLHDGNTVLQKLIPQPVVFSSDLMKVDPTLVPVAEGVGDHEHMKRHAVTLTSVDYAMNSQQDNAMWHTGSHLYHSLGVVMPKTSIDSDTAGDAVSVRTKLARHGTTVSKVTVIYPPENTQPNTIPCLSQPHLVNDKINKCPFVKTASPKYKILLHKAGDNNSSDMNHCETAKETLVHCEPASAFSKPETYTGTQNCVMSSHLESSTVKTIKNPELGSNIVENGLSDSQVSDLSVHEETAHNSDEKNNLKSYLVKAIKHNYATWMAGDPSKIENASATKSKTTTIKEINSSHKPGVQNNVKYSVGKKTKNIKVSEQPGNLKSANKASTLKTQKHNLKIAEDLKSSPHNRNLMNENNLDTSSNMCDLEVDNVLKECNSITTDKRKEENSGLNGKLDSDNVDDDRMSVASVSPSLSHVIEFLKTDAFNQAKESEGDGGSITDNKNTDNKDTDNKNTDTKTAYIDDTEAAYIAESEAAYIADTDSSPDKEQPGDNGDLAELMRQYLPETVQNNESNNNNMHFGATFNPDSKSKDLEVSNCDKDSKSKNIDGSDYDKNSKCKDPPAKFAEEEVELNINQNHFYDEDRDYKVLKSGRQRNLKYLERMADPALHDVTCRLALKATALRDVELRELIDEMILLTDASLGREDARFQSAQIFFAEENSKLKKRIQTVNQQLDAKERQERLGKFTHSDNDVLHLERKLMYLRDEKEKLDNQVTTLLEEKAKWLITQQDLVRTLSLKDHELLKLDEKHHEEKKSLLQSLEQATQNSQGVHYKLSVADKEISNLEQCIKSRNVEIANLKDMLKEMEGRLKECERLSKFKSQEILHLHDLVDALKVGVGHVLQAYESSSNKDTTTAEQRQGMENLRQMVHPEEYRSILTDPDVTAKTEERKIPTQGPHHYQQTFPSSQTSSLPKESKTKKPFVRQEDHPSSLRGRLYQRHHSMEDNPYRTDHYRRHRSRDDEQEMPPQRLTSETLKEHNKRFSPVNKLLWRSLDNEPKQPPCWEQDPYYSDSEIEINGRSRRRSSFHRCGTTAGNLHRQFKPQYHHPHGQSQARTEWCPRVQKDNNWDMARRSPDTTIPTLESETIPRSGDILEYSSADPLSEETYYSTLRSEPIPEKFSMSERKHGEINLAHESCHPRPLPVTDPRHRQKYNINKRNGQHQSLRQEYEHIPGSAVPENSWDLNGQGTHFILEPAHLPHDGHRSVQYDVETFPKTVHEGIRGSHPLYSQENPFTNTAQTDKKMLQSPNKSVGRGGGAFYMSQPHTHHIFSGRQPETAQFNDSLEHPSFSWQPTPSNDKPNDSTSFSDISLSRRATKNSDSITQREFFQGTELSASLSTISEVDHPSSNNNQLKSLNEDLFSSGIASLDEKIADLQRKIDRTKAKYS